MSYDCPPIPSHKADGEKQGRNEKDCSSPRAAYDMCHVIVESVATSARCVAVGRGGEKAPKKIIQGLVDSDADATPCG